MRLGVLALWAAILPSVAPVGRADSLPPGGVVSVDSLAGVQVVPGDTARVSLSVHIAQGFHVQANPASNEFLVPLQLDLQLADADSLVSLHPVYPEPERLRLRGASEDLLTYHGSIEIGLEIRIDGAAALGERSWDGELRYQACDDRRCLFPASVPVSLRVVVAPRGEP